MRFFLILLALAGILLVMFKDKLPFLKKPETQPSADDKQKTPSNTVKSDFPMSKGSTGMYVKQLQKALGIKDDGAWGNMTQKALEDAKAPTSFQSMAELEKAIAMLNAHKAAQNIIKI